MVPKAVAAVWAEERLRDFLYGDAGRDVTGAYGFTPELGDEFRSDLLAAYHREVGER